MTSRPFPLVIAAFAISVGATAAVAQTLVLPRESVWKYEDSGVALPSTWKDVSYPDTTWSQGPGPLGYGEPFIATVVSFGGNANDKHTTTYFRTTFDLPGDPLDVQALILRANFDDGVVVYLNGVEATRLSMPAGEITFDTFAFLHEGGGYETYDISTSIPQLTATGNVVAVEAHQANLTSSDLVMDLEIETSDQPAFVTRGPYLQIGRSDGMTIRWRTSATTDSRVWYGPSPENLNQTVDKPAIGFNHVVTLDGLLPSTVYFYAIGTTTEPLAGGDADHHFRTSPPAATDPPVRVWVIGDSGEPGPDQRNVRDAYLSHPGAANTDLWLMLGDNAYDSGTEPEYSAAVFDVYQTLLRTVPLWPTRGNHDVLRFGGNNDYLDFFTLPTAGEAGGVASGTEAYYSFDFANIHFVCLDSEGSSRAPGGPMLTWLQQDLAANASDWTIAYWHHPPYTKGSHDSDDSLDSGGRMRDMRQNALPVLEGMGVDLVLAGHSHSYERSFLLDGHYGVSSTLDPSMILDGGDGQFPGDGAYLKATPGAGAHEGVVYVVAGNASKLSGGPLNHPVMLSSLNILGSLVLDVTGGRLDATLIDDSGITRDFFTIFKGSGTSSPVVGAKSTLQVVARPNPFFASADVQFTVPAAGETRIRVIDALGREVRSLLGDHREAGEHQVSWDGRDTDGRAVAAGVYFVTLEHGESLRAAKIVRTR